jgi:hypothetical protein
MARLALAIALACPGVAWGAATPVSPGPGAVVSSAHPVFRWTLPPTERSQAIYVASAPQTTPQGQFFTENVVDADFFTSDTREWSPTSPLYAGSYWWNVWSTDQGTFDSYYSAPSAFSIPPQARVTRIDVRRNSYQFVPDDLDITVRWSANVREVVVTARLFRGRRALWSAREQESNTIGSPGRSFFDWTKPRRIRQGTRLRLVTTIRAGRLVRQRSRFVRAP